MVTIIAVYTNNSNRYESFVHTHLSNQTILFLTIQFNIQVLQRTNAFNKFPDFFVQAFKIIVDYWKFTMLLLYLVWDDWPSFMISGANKFLK